MEIRYAEVLNAREKERRQVVTPPVACTRRTRSEVSDDDEGDDDDDTNSVGAGANIYFRVIINSRFGSKLLAARFPRTPPA